MNNEDKLRKLKLIQLMWAFLIKNGSVQKWNFYSGNFVNWDDDGDKKTLKALREISRDGVDWDNTEEPRDGLESEFADTFHDSVMVDTMYGTIVTLAGKKFKFGTIWKAPRNVFDIVMELNELNFDEVLKAKCLNKREQE